MDLEGSFNEKKAGKPDKEESVEELIKKLHNRGAKVKLLSDDDVNAPPRGADNSMADKENMPIDGSNKENSAQSQIENEKLEELKRQNEQIQAIKDQQAQQNEQL